MDTFSGAGYGIARIRAPESDSNYNYVVWCGETSECAVIDPFDPVPVLNFIRDNGLRVKYIINTHCHPDHIKGNDPILKVTLAEILVHTLGRTMVSPRSRALNDGDTVRIGKLSLHVIHTPGHCPEHLILVMDGNVFTGDTLYLAGCGNLKHRGDGEELFKTMETKIRTLGDDLRIFPGHDYAEANLRFALDIEPGNKEAKKKLADIRKLVKKGKEPAPTTIGEEKTYNPFLRYDSPGITKELRKRNPSLGDSNASYFKELRKLRDEWK
ncbi:MAG: hydroxyacylglutathione hydrolase [Thermodesulfobacteriota bacterium]